MLIACPFFIATLYTPFPAAWVPMFVAIFFLFLNTGPSNTALANVSLPAVRATAFAVNILVIHALGAVQAFWLLGYIGGHTNMQDRKSTRLHSTHRQNSHAAFCL